MQPQKGGLRTSPEGALRELDSQALLSEGSPPHGGSSRHSHSQSSPLGVASLLSHSSTRQSPKLISLTSSSTQPTPEATEVDAALQGFPFTIPKRLKIGNLKQDQSTSPVRSTPSPKQRGRPIRRRSLSADPTTRRRDIFRSPDRFVSSRNSLTIPESPFRLSKASTSLPPPERYSRRRDRSANPFRSTSPSRSRVTARIPANQRVSPPQYTPSFVHGVDVAPGNTEFSPLTTGLRQISAGAIWNVGGSLATQLIPSAAIPTGRGGLAGSGTTAPMHVAHFLDNESQDQDLRRHENRLAIALDVDPSCRVLSNADGDSSLHSSPFHSSPGHTPYLWHDSSWIRGYSHRPDSPSNPSLARSRISSIPFRVLDAPRIRDDYYCSVLAYSDTCRALAVAIGNLVYLWTERDGVEHPPLLPTRVSNYVTSVSFSSTEGGHSILAIGRQGGQVTLWRPLEREVRFDARHPNPVSCLSFKSSVSRRRSTYFLSRNVLCEDLLVGDDLGDLYYYSVEWPDPAVQRTEPLWRGSMTVLAKVSAHSQQICGIAWSPDEKYFVTGGNDNIALLFEISKILDNDNPPRGRSLRRRAGESDPVITALTPPVSVNPPVASELVRNWIRFSEEGEEATSQITLIGPLPSPSNPTGQTSMFPATQPALTPPTSPSHSPRGCRMLPSQKHRLRTRADVHILTHPPGLQSQTFVHTAAVKALAFAPWQPSLLATGGGSNDRQIHFFHTGSGAVLALINVFAQVTSLIWSKTKREICGTFGYAQPEHKIRIAVFSWPKCECVVAIPWETRVTGTEVPRALWAVKFPGGPNRAGRSKRSSKRRDHAGEKYTSDRREGEMWASRTQEEGCIIVAGSDENIKFHEVWAGERRGARGGLGLGHTRGVLGGSKVLEGVREGIDVEDFALEGIR